MAQMLVITSPEEVPQLVRSLRAKGLLVAVPSANEAREPGARVEVFVTAPDCRVHEAYEALADAA